MSTAADLITLALKDIQVLDATETPDASLMADALATLNQMIALWQTDKAFIFAQIDTTFAANGSQTYTVGTGGNFNVSAPVRIDYAFLRANNIDYPIQILNKWEEYQSISYKAVSGTWPEVAYYNATTPLATLYVYPKPTSGTIHLISSTTFPVYATSADAISFPAEYDMAIRFSLAEILSSMMGVPVRADIIKLARNTRNVIRKLNFQVGELNLGRSGGNGYLPILGDRT